MARFYQRGKETRKEPSGRLRLVPSASFSSLSRKGKTSDFNLFVSKIATRLSGTSSSAWTLDFPITMVDNSCFMSSSKNLVKNVEFEDPLVEVVIMSMNKKTSTR